MKWKDKEIQDLTNSELVDASFTLMKTHEDMMKKRNTEKFKKKFAGQPPPETNPAFEQLRKEVSDEISKRNLV